MSTGVVTRIPLGPYAAADAWSGVTPFAQDTVGSAVSSLGASSGGSAGVDRLPGMGIILVGRRLISGVFRREAK